MRYGAPFLCSSPTILLSAVAQRTSRVRVLTGVTVLSVHAPVLMAEKYELLRQLWSQENVTVTRSPGLAA
jgi:alkanesulfonate monooxygenase SsuD/methylene tetrahydromethanopterin reductase-like flavin-dependent oxidoreductase (luciferase family)